MKLLDELKRRHLVRLVVSYLAGGWIVLEVIDQLVGNEVIPAVLYPAALTLLLGLIPAVAIRSWYHGAKGDQKGTLREYAMLGVVGVIAVGATGYVVQRELADPTLSALDRLDPTENPSRIAVTYFEATGSAEEAELLAAGLTESLIDVLARVPEIHVVSRNGVAPLRGRASFPTDSVAAALGVGTLVQGRVAESDSMVRVRVDVVRARDGRSIGSETIQRPRSELFELQDQLAEQVAFFLRETIGPHVQLVEDEARVENVDAWVKVQQAAGLEAEASELMALEDVDGAEDRMNAADSVLADAARLAPGWSVPLTRRGWLDYQRARWGGFDRSAIPDLLADAREDAERALARKSDDASALELRATVNYWSYLLNLTSEPGEAERLLEDARRDFEAATDANPAQASAYSSLSHLLMNTGETAQAKIAAQRSYDVDPWLTNANLTLLRLFQASLDLQDEQQARTYCDAGTERFPTDYRFVECRVWLYALPTSDAAARAAAMDDAWAQCDAVTELSPIAVKDYNRKACEMVLAMGLVQADLPDSARAVARRARAGTDVDPIRDLAYLESIVLTLLGDYDGAVERLATYIAANPGSAASFARDRTWWLEDLRGFPAYERLVASP